MTTSSNCLVTCKSEQHDAMYVLTSCKANRLIDQILQNARDHDLDVSEPGGVMSFVRTHVTLKAMQLPWHHVNGLIKTADLTAMKHDSNAIFFQQLTRRWWRRNRSHSRRLMLRTGWGSGWVPGKSSRNLILDKRIEAWPMGPGNSLTKGIKRNAKPKSPCQ